MNRIAMATEKFGEGSWRMISVDVEAVSAYQQEWHGRCLEEDKCCVIAI
jgi:hypothetical protein